MNPATNGSKEQVVLDGRMRRLRLGRRVFIITRAEVTRDGKHQAHIYTLLVGRA